MHFVVGILVFLVSCTFADTDLQKSFVAQTSSEGSIETVMQSGKANEAFGSSWLQSNSSNTRVHRELLKDLKYIRSKEGVYSGHYLAPHHIVTHISLSLGRLVQPLTVSEDFHATEWDWIVLV